MQFFPHVTLSYREAFFVPQGSILGSLIIVLINFFLLNVKKRIVMFAIVINKFLNNQNGNMEKYLEEKNSVETWLSGNKFMLWRKAVKVGFVK